MKVTITTDFKTINGIYAGIRHMQVFTNFTRLLKHIRHEYKKAKQTGSYIQIHTILRHTINEAQLEQKGGEYNL